VRFVVLSAARDKGEGLGYRTFNGRYFIEGGQWYCRLNGVRYSEHYMEDTSKQVDIAE
jgi:hypothetical protein